MIPVVPHKAVAEVSKIGNLLGKVGCCESRMAVHIVGSLTSKLPSIRPWPEENYVSSNNYGLWYL